MPTLVQDPQPAEFEALLERRRNLGQDLLDEVWDGVYHVNPAPHGRHANIQQQLAVLLDPLARQAGLLPRVGIFDLGEPRDYRVPDGGLLRLGPDELLIVGPEEERVDWLGLQQVQYGPVERSGLIDLSAAELSQRIVWPR